jgi:hypothetical protein
MSYSGECFCSAVAYRIAGQLIEPRSCHRSRCRKAFSGAGSAYTELRPGEFTWLHGDAAISVHGDPARWALGFCRYCGFHRGQVQGITLGTLNDARACLPFNYSAVIER